MYYIVESLGGSTAICLFKGFYWILPKVRNYKTLEGQNNFGVILLQKTGFPGDAAVKNPPAVQETQVWSLGWEDPLEKGMATHSSILGQRSLVGYSPCGCKESNTTE